LTEFFYRWRRAGKGEEVDPPPPHLLPLVDEVFYWTLKQQRGISFVDLGHVPSPALLAALDAYSMGLNWAENELAEEAKEAAERERREAERRGGAR
jgi:hypothetical protein